jgi:hypothetical protein
MSLYGPGFDQLAASLSQGNPIAYEICRYLWGYSRRVDPDTQDQLSVMRTLNEFAVRADRLVVLQKTICRDSYAHTMAVAHALRMQFLSIERLNLAIAGGTQLDFGEIRDQVRRELPNFGYEKH